MSILNAVPDDTTLIRWAKVIQPKTLKKFNERIVQLAVERKVTSGRKLRTEGTVVESHLRSPSDDRLRADGVRVLARAVMRTRELVKQAVQEPFGDPTQAAKALSRQIGARKPMRRRVPVGSTTRNCST